MSASIVDNAKDADIRNSNAAMERAGLRAREIAIQTNTTLIATHNGQIVELDPRTMQPIAPKSNKAGESLPIPAA